MEPPREGGVVAEMAVVLGDEGAGTIGGGAGCGMDEKGAAGEREQHREGEKKRSCHDGTSVSLERRVAKEPAGAFTCMTPPLGQG